MTSNNFSHLDSNNSPNMVNVHAKATTTRIALATATIIFSPTIFEQLTKTQSSTDLVGPKGSILNTAKLAGIMAAKKTSDLIPLCHQIPLDNVKIDFVISPERHAILITAESICHSKTGVEMESLTAATIAALTIYDMCKALGHEMKIQEIEVISKQGGKHDFKR